VSEARHNAASNGLGTDKELTIQVQSYALRRSSQLSFSHSTGCSTVTPAGILTGKGCTN
jgi:hypothetical protein